MFSKVWISLGSPVQSHPLRKVNKFQPGKKSSHFSTADFWSSGVLQPHHSTLAHHGPLQAQLADREKSWLFFRGCSCCHSDVKCILLEVVNSN